jgi:2-oxoglutarate ferredoxin oxidoreductase subunit gamma
MVMSTKSFVFTGSGGQGVITASIILGEAAAIYEGLNAVQTQVYGPEARGGATRADVVISSAPIRFPKVINPYVLICLTQEAYNKYGRLIRPGGLMIVDPFYVTVSKNVDAYQIALPMYETIKREIGKTMVLNTCMLGCVVALSDVVKPDSIIKALRNNMAPEHHEMNIRAFELGMGLGESYQGGGRMGTARAKNQDKGRARSVTR